MDVEQIERQIERCRRIASMIVDEDARHALESLAKVYRAKLPRRHRSFMLSRAQVVRSQPLRALILDLVERNSRGFIGVGGDQLGAVIVYNSVAAAEAFR